MVQCSQGPSDPEEGRAAGQWRSCGDSLRRRGGLPDRRRAAQIGVQDQRPRRRGRGGDEEEADGVGGGAGRRRPQPDGGPCCRCRSPASCWACGRLRPPQPLHLTDGPTSSERNLFLHFAGLQLQCLQSLERRRSCLLTEQEHPFILLQFA